MGHHFQHDLTADGRALRLVNVVDEFTREALIMEVGRSISADETVTELEALVARRGRAPRFLRCDNGPELASHALLWSPRRRTQRRSRG